MSFINICQKTSYGVKSITILPMNLALSYVYLVNVRYGKGLFTSTYSAIYKNPMYNHSKHLVKLHSSRKYINLLTVLISICPKLSMTIQGID